MEKRSSKTTRSWRLKLLDRIELWREISHIIMVPRLAKMPRPFAIHEKKPPGRGVEVLVAREAEAAPSFSLLFVLLVVSFTFSTLCAPTTVANHACGMLNKRSNI